RANLAVIPDALSDDAVLMCPDIFSTGLSGAESGHIKVGDAVAIFAQGPIGLCATAGARLKGASLVIGVDPLAERLEIARAFGADVTINTSDGDPVAAIKRLTDGRGVDVAIEALGRQETFDAAVRAIRPGGTLSSLGVYSGKLVAPYEALYAGLGDQRIVTTLCPGGKERMRRLHGDDRARAHRRVTPADASLSAGADRRGVRPVQPPAGRGAESGALSGRAGGRIVGQRAARHRAAQGVQHRAQIDDLL